MDSSPDFTFSHPYLLLLLEIIPVLLIFYFRNYRRSRSIIQISSFSGFVQYRKTLRQKLIHLPFIFRILSLFCLIVAMADPKMIQYNLTRDTSPSESILLVDISQNSLAKDFNPNRLNSLKLALDHFLDSHLGQSFGLVTMGNEVVTRVPITEDTQTLKNALDDLNPEFTASTNLSEGLETSLLNFEESVADHKQVIIFLSGNPSSRNLLNPALEAKKFGISLHPFVLASEGFALSPVYYNQGIHYINQVINIREKPLRDLAAVSGGTYFRSGSNSELDQNFLKLNDVLEKLKTKKDPNYTGILPFAWMAAIFLILEIILRYTLFKSLP